MEIGDVYAQARLSALQKQCVTCLPPAVPCVTLCLVICCVTCLSAQSKRHNYMRCWRGFKGFQKERRPSLFRFVIFKRCKLANLTAICSTVLQMTTFYLSEKRTVRICIWLAF